MGAAVMSDIVRVPIQTVDGPAFILVGTSGNANHTSTGNNRVPEGLIIVKEATNGLDVQFVASEEIPDNMKSLIIEKMAAINLSNESEDKRIPVRDSSDSGKTIEVAAIHDSDVPVSTTTSPIISTEIPVNQEYAVSPDDSPSSTYMYVGEIAETNEEQTSMDQPTMSTGVPAANSLFNGTATSTVAPRPGKIDSKGNQSGKSGGQRDSSSSAKNSHAFIPTMITIFACVFVSLSVGIL